MVVRFAFRMALASITTVGVGASNPSLAIRLAVTTISGVEESSALSGAAGDEASVDGAGVSWADARPVETSAIAIAARLTFRCEQFQERAIRAYFPV
jgi:hypothetical protein